MTERRQMLEKRSLLATVLFALTAATLAVGAEMPGATATEIKIGNTNPYSGPASAYSVFAKLETAFFRDGQRSRRSRRSQDQLHLAR